MKLLMISGDRNLAQGRKGAFYNTLEEFRKYWNRIDIICPKIPNLNFQISNKSQISISKSRFFDNVFIHPSPWPLIFQPLWILKKGREIYREQKFDLMTVHEYPPFYNGIGARLLWNKIRASYVLEIMHIPGHPRASSFKERFYKILMKVFIKFDSEKALAIRVINKKEVPDFLKKNGIPEEKIVYIPAFYIDLEVFRSLGLEKNYDLIFVGRLEKNKGPDLLIDAASKLKTQILNFRMIIVGNGPLEHNLKFKIENLKLQNNILLYGWAKDSKEVARLLNESKILVMPSYNEGGPRVVLEAMACGVPVITTKVGLMPDIIKDGENGLFIDWVPEDLAERINYLINNAELQEKFSTAGLKIVEQFEKKAAIKNYADKLKEILLS